MDVHYRVRIERFLMTRLPKSSVKITCKSETYFFEGFLTTIMLPVQPRRYMQCVVNSIDALALLVAGLEVAQVSVQMGVR